MLYDRSADRVAERQRNDSLNENADRKEMRPMMVSVSNYKDATSD